MHSDQICRFLLKNFALKRKANKDKSTEIYDNYPASLNHLTQAHAHWCNAESPKKSTKLTMKEDERTLRVHILIVYAVQCNVQ